MTIIIKSNMISLLLMLLVANTTCLNGVAGCKLCADTTNCSTCIDGYAYYKTFYNSKCYSMHLIRVHRIRVQVMHLRHAR